ncbi:hypothetical protein HNQ50_001358 [Silvimonas terrae]|uniref:Nucleotidyltransferase-like protein n=1 Tax=Silvimonas terrae TaxID=300266 RepID=A0A840RDX4_9NEIS|nr:hypothetical protein [Silvimonas terrae]MBB5190636.1 hypothetical protein [Silvimonas terrae]
MNSQQSLLRRLDEIGLSLARCGDAIALFGLGSAGVERERMDQWSDLDFFAIAAPGKKARLIDQLDWLSDIRPLAFQYRNTIDGHKVMFDDGVFCEFAVFELEELPAIFYSPGQMVWSAPGITLDICQPVAQPPAPRTEKWLVGEILGNLYVGLGRYARGERLSGFRLVQVDAVNRVLELTALTGPAAAPTDRFAPERRFESRFPATAVDAFMPGYTGTPQAALAILSWLENRHGVNVAMSRQIRQWADAAEARFPGELMQTTHQS